MPAAPDVPASDGDSCRTPAIAALAAAFDRLGVPAGWHAMRTEDRLEARWSSSSGAWARLSAGLGRPPHDADQQLLVSSPVGPEHVWISFVAKELDRETLVALAAVWAAFDAAASPADDARTA